MAKISLNKAFILDSLSVFKQRGIKGLLLGHKADLSSDERKLVSNIKSLYKQTKGARKGSLAKVDAVHKGSGEVYLVEDSGKAKLVFDSESKVTNGPDLWVYLSKSSDPKKSLGDYKDLGLIKGTKGGQVYGLNAPIKDFEAYKSVIIYCKQFEVLFSYAILGKPN